MSLTFFFRTLIFLAVAAASVQATWLYSPALLQYLVDARNSTIQLARFDSRSLVYRMDMDRPITFTYSHPVELTKIIVQPSVREDLRGLEEGFVYALRIRLFDSEGMLIDEHEKYLFSRSPNEVFASGDVWRFFRDRPEVVAGQDELLIESDPRASAIEFSIIEAQEGIVGVELRVYEHRPFQESQSRSTFNRRSDYEQRALAQANAFPPDLLTDEEIANLTRNMWRPVGPNGIEGRDYTALVLYEGTRLPGLEDEQ
jgi:hypothetical protein